MQTITLKRTGWLAATLLVLLVGCKKSTDVVTPANQECQLQSDLTVVSTGSQSATKYTYNGNGQLISSVISSSTGGVSTGTTTTNTYTYDASGNLTTAQEGSDVTTYEYTNGRLTKESLKEAGTLSSTTSYTYDASGRVTNYVSTDYTYSNPVVESYAFTNGVLTGGSLTSGAISVSIAVANGRIASQTFPDGTRYRYTYDASGYLTRVDQLNSASVVQGYTVYEYGTTAYKGVNIPPVNRPTVNTYGTTGLPFTRQASYTGAGVLSDELRAQYQTNAKGYLTSSTTTINSSTYGKGSYTTTYAYSNCQ